MSLYILLGVKALTNHPAGSPQYHLGVAEVPYCNAQLFPRLKLISLQSHVEKLLYVSLVHLPVMSLCAREQSPNNTCRMFLTSIHSIKDFLSGCLEAAREVRGGSRGCRRWTCPSMRPEMSSDVRLGRTEVLLSVASRWAEACACTVFAGGGGSMELAYGLVRLRHR